ncbi:MAG: flagellar biosynthetic protein FliP, partial [Lachnospiraceae bacterium]|nr:flagellar biosynthetic protein FliP [Lachnospiraceae bacterium]
MKNKSRKYKIGQELRKIAYMLCMVVIILLADIAVANATSVDDGAAAEQILDNRQEENENRTNIKDAGSAETSEELEELNIANELKITLDRGNGELSGTLRILLILTAIAIAPILLVTITSFTRILIVLHFTRQALNTQSAPPNQVLLAIALFLTFFIMQPVFGKIYTEAIVPYDAGEIGFEEALEVAAAPMRQFMFEQTQAKDIDAFMQISNTAWDGETQAQVPTTVLIPSF